MLGYGTPSIVQLTLIAFLFAYAWTVRKMNRGAIAVAAAAIGLLHMYDHLYRVKRGEENLFLLPEEQTENYKSFAKNIRKNLKQTGVGKTRRIGGRVRKAFR